MCHHDAEGLTVPGGLFSPSASCCRAVRSAAADCCHPSHGLGSQSDVFFYYSKWFFHNHPFLNFSGFVLGWRGSFSLSMLLWASGKRIPCYCFSRLVYTVVFFVCHRLKPGYLNIVFEICNRYVNHFMGCGGSVPMLHVFGNVDDIAFFYRLCRLSFFLIKTFPFGYQQYLSFRMGMPVGSCIGFKGDAAYRKIIVFYPWPAITLKKRSR